MDKGNSVLLLNGDQSVIFIFSDLSTDAFLLLF